VKHLRLRREIVATARRMIALGLTQGTSGNVSARAGERFLITPSGVAYEDMRPSDIVEMGFDGKVVGNGAPSTEWRFHRAILAARPEVNAVVHAHSMFATTLSCLGLDIPAFHYMIAVAGGRSIRCAPYATFGSEELSRHALAALEGRGACLLANHGMIAVGGTLDNALALALEVETLAAQYWRALQVGKPVILSDEEMDTVLEKFKTYGRRARRAPPRRKR
jgi:L-fuculose-phosphate aldolase